MAEMVYAIGSAENTRVKIGRSNDVQRRLADIQRMGPAPLTVLWQHEGGSELELALHQAFKERRTHGEWFDFAGVDPVAQIEVAVIALEMSDEELDAGIALFTALKGRGRRDDLEKLVKSLPPERIAELIDQLKADHPEWYEVTRVRANIRHRTAAS